MTKPIETDIQLCQKIIGGDKKAYGALFERFYPRLCAYACQWVSLEDAENVVQDIFLWIWQNHTDLHIETSVRTYLFTATRNRCLTLINRGKVSQQVINNLKQNATEHFESPDFYILDDLMSKLNTALDTLPDSYREAFVLHRLNNKSHKEIAGEMGVSQKTIEYRISQALKALRIALKDFLPILLLILPPPNGLNRRYRFSTC